MKKKMTLQRHPDTYPGDDLYCLDLKLSEMTLRELLEAMRTIQVLLYPAIDSVALKPVRSISERDHE